MPDISFRRDHHLGLEHARRLVGPWIAHVEKQYGLRCRREDGVDADVVRFERTGLHGTLRVDGTAFDVQATLGFLLGGLKGSIERQMREGFDEMLAADAAGRTPPAAA